MFKEEKLIPDFDIQEMLSKVIDKYIAPNHVLFETPVYEKVNDELWFIYFTSKHNESSSDWKSKMYYQVVMGFACISDYYFNTDLIDEDKNKPLDDLKIRFRNYLKSLLEKSEELTEADYWDGDETDAMDIYDDEQIDKYGSELDYGMTEEDRMEMLKDIYEDDLIEPTQADLRSSEPEYVIASTSYGMEETYVFEANEQGEITNLSEYGGIALRFGDIDWTNKALAVERIFGEGKYEFVKEIDRVAKADHHLFKRIYEEPEYPLPSDTYDGGISDEK